MECPKCGHKIYIELTLEELIFCPYCEQRMVAPKAESLLQEDEDIAPALNEEPAAPPKLEELPAAPVREETAPHMVEEAPPVNREPEQPAPASACEEVSRPAIEENPFMRWERENRERLQRETTPPVIETAHKQPPEPPEEVPQPVMEKPVLDEEPPPHVALAPPPVVIPDEVPQPVSEETRVAEAAFCSTCGRKLTPGFRFCPRCGQKVALLEGDMVIEQIEPAPANRFDTVLPQERIEPVLIPEAPAPRKDISQPATEEAPVKPAAHRPVPRDDISEALADLAPPLPHFPKAKAQPSREDIGALVREDEPKPTHPLLPTMHVVPSTPPKASGEPLWPKITAWISRTLQPLKDFVGGHWQLRRLYHKWAKDGVVAPDEIPTTETLNQITREAGGRPQQPARLVSIIVASIVFVAFFLLIGIVMSRC